LARAWRYADDTLSAEDAQRIILDCREPTGWPPLLVLSVEDTLQQARGELADHPQLRRLIADACFHVGDKWESHGDELWEARRWAINVALRYAAEEGIASVRLDDGRRAARLRSILKRRIRAFAAFPSRHNRLRSSRQERCCGDRLEA
jgi:hypothetical protein